MLQKIDKFGMILIMGIIFSAVCFLEGHGAVVVPLILIISLISEYVMKRGGYKNIKQARRSYVVFMLYYAANLLPLYISRDAYFQSLVDQGYGVEYATKLMSVLPNWSFVPIALLGMLGGYIGCTIGIKLLNKHFKKAGMA